MKPMEIEPVAILPLNDDERKMLITFRKLTSKNKTLFLCDVREIINSQNWKEGNIIYPHPSVWGRTAVV